MTTSSSRRRQVLWVVGLLVLTALFRCGSSVRPCLGGRCGGDGAVATDASTDAAVTDAGGADAGSLDGGGTADGGSPTDSGVDGGALGGGLDGGVGDAGECDPVAQQGCSSGDKCTIAFADGGTGCFPSGAIDAGQICGTAGPDDCSAGLLCLNFGTAAACRHFCRGDSDCTQPAVPSGSTPEPSNVGRCAITLTIGWNVCTWACNPVALAGPAGCPGTLSCLYGVTSSHVEVTDCESAGAVAEGGVCSTQGCAAGLVCVNGAGAQPHCRQVCRNGNASDCSATGDTCLAPTGVTSPMFGFCCPATGC